MAAAAVPDPDSSYATARFAAVAEGAWRDADLGGGTFRLANVGLTLPSILANAGLTLPSILANAGLTFASNLGEVTIRNGTLTFNSSGDDPAFGASGTTVVFDSVNLGGFRGLKFTATLAAPTLDTSSASCVFRLDVTDWQGGRKVPLVTFTGADQSAAIEKVEMTLRAYAKGVNVTAKRGAELVWSAEDNTLYYRQKPQGATMIMFQ